MFDEFDNFVFDNNEDFSNTDLGEYELKGVDIFDPRIDDLLELGTLMPSNEVISSVKDIFLSINSPNRVSLGNTSKRK